LLDDDQNDSEQNSSIYDEGSDVELFDPFDRLFKVKPQLPGEYRGPTDERDF